MSDEIERLRAELAAERERAVEKLAIWRKQSDADERMIYKLRKALKPFAKAYSLVIPDEHPLRFKPNSNTPELVEGDLRRAFTVYAETKGDGDE
jgi:hypothetical protein